jgi:hypothetical protein
MSDLKGKRMIDEEDYNSKKRSILDSIQNYTIPKKEYTWH